MKSPLKTALSLLCALALTLSLAGCGGNSDSTATGQTETSAPAPANTPSAAPTETPIAQVDPVSETVTAADPDVHYLILSEHSALLDGEPVAEYDYTWHCDPSVSHDEVKNAPAEYHTGTQPDTDAAAYIDSDLPYYPMLPEEGFTLVNYDGEQEYAYYYTDGEHDEYIFATLPRLGNALPTDMMHTEAEAAENRVLHITRPGTYSIDGIWLGQIRVELGDKDEVFADETKKVTFILNGVEVNCTVAPGILFESAYETDHEWETREVGASESAPYEMDAADAGVTVLLAEGTENDVTGKNVYRMLKTKYKDESSTDAVKVQKKQRKTDAAFYSCVSMTIGGSGSLYVISGFEGLDSELHLTILGGNIAIYSQDDGINVNEDHVSTVRFAGGDVVLYPAKGAEGDGVDSNGYIVLDGGTLRVNGVRPPDSALDSECGMTYLGGLVILDGVLQTYTPGAVYRESIDVPGGMGGTDFPGMGGGFSMDFDLADFKAKVAALPDDATLEDVLALLGWGGMPGDMGGGFGGMEGQQPPQGGFGGQPGEPPQGGQPMGGDQPPEPPQGGTGGPGMERP